MSGVYSMAQLRIPLDDRDCTGFLFIFDKDGTLIDFDFMWGSWITDLARHLEAAAYISIAPQLFQAVGFDPATGEVAPTGPLAVATMAEIRDLAGAVLRAAGLSPASAAAAIQ